MEGASAASEWERTVWWGGQGVGWENGGSQEVGGKVVSVCHNWRWRLRDALVVVRVNFELSFILQ